MESVCPNPPCSLILVSSQDKNIDVVVGHCRIVPVKDEEHMLYVEAGKNCCFRFIIIVFCFCFLFFGFGFFLVFCVLFLLFLFLRLQISSDVLVVASCLRACVPVHYLFVHVFIRYLEG